MEQLCEVNTLNMHPTNDQLWSPKDALRCGGVLQKLPLSSEQFGETVKWSQLCDEKNSRTLFTTGTTGNSMMSSKTTKSLLILAVKIIDCSSPAPAHFCLSKSASSNSLVFVPGASMGCSHWFHGDPKGTLISGNTYDLRSKRETGKVCSSHRSQQLVASFPMDTSYIKPSISRSVEVSENMRLQPHLCQFTSNSTIKKCEICQLQFVWYEQLTGCFTSVA